MQYLAWTKANIIYDFREVSEITPKRSIPRSPYIFPISELGCHPFILGDKTQPRTQANHLSGSVGQTAEAKPFMSWVSPGKRTECVLGWKEKLMALNP